MLMVLDNSRDIHFQFIFPFLPDQCFAVLNGKDQMKITLSVCACHKINIAVLRTYICFEALHLVFTL